MENNNNNMDSNTNNTNLTMNSNNENVANNTDTNNINITNEADTTINNNNNLNTINNMDATANNINVTNNMSAGGNNINLANNMATPNSNITPPPNNTEKGNKKNIIPIIIGIGCFIFIMVAIAVGYFFLGKNKDKILQTAIHNFSENLIVAVDENIPDELNFQNDVSFSGTLSFDTSQDLEEWDALKKMQYGVEVEVSFPKKIAKLGLNVKEKNKEILSGKIFYQDNKGYINVPDLLKSTIETDEIDFDFSQLPENKMNKEEYKKYITEIRDIIIASINKEKIEQQKNIQKTYKDKTIQTDEYIYHFDAENQKQMLEQILERLDLSSEIKEQVKSNFDSKEEITFTVTTTGLQKEIVSWQISVGTNKIEWIDYKDQKSIHINENTTIDFTEENGEKHIILNSENIKAEMTYKIEKEGSSKVNSQIELTLTIDKENYQVKLEGSIDSNANITKEKVTNPKTTDEFTEEENLELYTNFLKKVRGTALEELISDLFAGNV